MRWFIRHIHEEIHHQSVMETLFFHIYVNRRMDAHDDWMMARYDWTKEETHQFLTANKQKQTWMSQNLAGLWQLWRHRIYTIQWKDQKNNCILSEFKKYKETGNSATENKNLINGDFRYRRQPLLSSLGSRVGDMGKLVNNAGEQKRGKINAAHQWAEEDFLDAACSAHEKKDSAAKNTLKVSLSSLGGSRRTVLLQRTTLEHPV